MIVIDHWVPLLALAASLIAISFFLFDFRFGYRPRTHRLPPGPTALPLVGNVLELMRKEKWELLAEYKKEYGDVVYLHGLGNSIVVLNTMQAIDDLLCKRASVYSQRPVLTVVGELMGLDKSTVLRQNDAEWRLHRRFAHIVLSQAAVKQYHIVQEDLARRLCFSLLTRPENFNADIRLFSGRVVIAVTYGLSVETADSKYIKHADATMDLVCHASMPGAYLCDLLPFMKHLPSWMPFQKEAVIGKQMIEDLITAPFEHVKRDMRNGSAAPSLTQELLSMERDNIPDFEQSVKWTTGSMYGAGGESTYATVLIFVLAMALHPSVQLQAQKEIDEVIGSQRLPSIADKSQLPFVNAVIKETMRWRPIVPLTLGRRTSQDDIYRGLFIPKGAMVVPNVWAVAFEANEKYDPQQFLPERFLDPTEDIVDPSSWAFGFGKRMCPGKALGENSVFIAIASILWAFTISPPKHGSLDPKFTHKLISYPEPFACQIIQRSEERSALLSRT